jgi:hypothetical protein
MPIKYPAFIIGIIAGFVLLRFYGADRPIFYKWPTPDNAGKVNYKDKNGVCYQYESTEVDCAANKEKVKPLPLTVPQPYLIMK